MDQERPDKCYFCGILTQYNFISRIPVCADHFDQMYHQEVPDYVDDSQRLLYKKLALEKKIWKV